MSRANQGGIIVTGAFLSKSTDSYQFQAGDSFFAAMILRAPADPFGLPTGNWLSLIDTTTDQAAPAIAVGNLPNQGSEVNSTGDIVMYVWLNTGHEYLVSVTNWSPAAIYTLKIAYDTASAALTVPPQALPVGTTASVNLTLTSRGPISTANIPSTNSLLTAILPGTINATQIVPVSYTVTSGATNLLAPAGSTNIPASVYVALGAGPVGGFAGTSGGNLNVATDVYDRIYGQSPALALSERFIGLAVLSQIGTASHVDVSAPATPTAADRATLPTGALKTDATLDLEDDDLAPDDQVRATPEEMLFDGGPVTVANAGVISQNADTLVISSPTREQRLDAAIAVSVLFAALGEKWRRQGRPGLDIEV